VPSRVIAQTRERKKVETRKFDPQLATIEMLIAHPPGKISETISQNTGLRPIPKKPM
jgi:hypothetical protein